MPWRVFITVAEPSADQHAAGLVRELLSMNRGIIVEGLGGQAMRDAGAIIHSDTVSRSMMGWKSWIRLFEVMRLLKWTRNYFRENPPDLQICVDSWSGNRHWAKLAHDMGIPVLYYIAPQIWASRPGRVKALRRYVDRVACILPFEEKYLKDRHVEATFVGHPLFDKLPRHSQSVPSERFPDRPPVIGLIPGSRASVARENFPSLLEVADRIRRDYPQATFLIPTLPTTHPVIMDMLKARPPESAQPHSPPSPSTDSVQETVGPFTVGVNQFDELVPQCDLCISVSGTATLHAAGHGVPLIVVYRVHPLAWHLVARWVVKTRTFSLVNLLSSSRENIVPEFIPWYGSTDPVANKAIEYLKNPRKLEEQRDRLHNLIRTLNKPGASRNTANVVMELLTARADTRMPDARFHTPG